MFGDADASSLPGEEVHTMTEEERAVSFHHKPLAARAAVIAAGPGANFLFTIVVLTCMFATVGQRYTPPNIGVVQPESAAAEAGVQAGDVFVSIDGQAVNRFEDVQQAVRLNTGTPMQVVVRRDDKDVTLSITPRMTETVDRFGNHDPATGCSASRVAASPISSAGRALPSSKPFMRPGRWRRGS
ncbi:MAG: PDZ domain-containing protein [Aliidongia sp.]